MIDDNPMKQVVFLVPAGLYHPLKEEADRKAQSLSAMIRLILAERYSGKAGGTSNETRTNHATPIFDTPR
jgi:hypothetical protein